MLIDLYEILQEEGREKHIQPPFDTKEFKTKKACYPVKGYDIQLSFHHNEKKHVSFTCKGNVTLAIHVTDVWNL